MEAYISGSAGILGVPHGNSIDIYRDGHEQPTRVPKAESDRIFRDCQDAIRTSVTNQRQAVARLREEADRADALTLFLTIISDKIPEDTKPELADQLEALLGVNPGLEEFLLNTCCARPLPDGAIEEAPISLVGKERNTSTIVTKLLSLQEAIDHYYENFKHTCNSSGFAGAEIDITEGYLVRKGFPYSLLSRSLNRAEINNIKFNGLLDLPNLGVKSNVRSFVNQFFGNLASYIEDHPSEGFRALKPETETETQAKTHPKSRRTTHEAYTSAVSQIERISNLLERGEIDTAERFAEQLTREQVESGSEAYAAQSLCQLSEAAKRHNLHELQLQWAKRALEVAPDDARSLGHIADAYLHLEDYGPAKEFFESSIEAGGNFRSYGLLGLARIERTFYEFENALNYVTQATEEFPGNEIARNFRAELLRNLGRLSDSIIEYKKCIGDFPESSVSFCGLAAVYTDIKDFAEAENNYKLAIELFPDAHTQVVARCGLGFNFARQAKFSEAHKFLDEAVEMSSAEDSVPRSAKAKAYVLEGDFDAAEKYYLQLLERQHTSQAYHVGLIELYLEFGRTDKAEEAIHGALKEYIRNEEILILESKLHKMTHRYEDALALLDSIRKNKPRMIPALLERALIFKMSGNFQEARAQYLEVLEINIHEKRAHIGLALVNSLLGEAQKLKNVRNDLVEGQPVTSDDFIQVGVAGLLQLNERNYRDAKKLLSVACNCEFGLVRSKFASSLSMAKVMLNQMGSAGNPVSNASDAVALIQKSIVFGERRNFGLASAIIREASQSAPPYAAKVIDLVTRRYCGSTVSTQLIINQDDVPSFEQIAQAQIENFLMAA